MSTKATFEQIREALKMRQSDFAASLGISRSYLSLLENGHRTPSADLQRRLNELAQTRLRSNATASGVRHVPILSWASAGPATAFEELPESWEHHIPTDCPDENAFGLVVDGDSMEPNYRPGDVIVVMPSFRPRSNGLVAARLKDRGVRFKMLTICRSVRPFHLSSYNSGIYPPEDFEESEFDWIYPVYEMRRVVWK